MCPCPALAVSEGSVCYNKDKAACVVRMSGIYSRLSLIKSLRCKRPSLNAICAYRRAQQLGPHSSSPLQGGRILSKCRYLNEKCRAVGATQCSSAHDGFEC